MKARGFTLIEVLIAIGVIGILSAIALPIYRGYVAKAEAASVTVAGLTSNFQSQLDAAEGPGNATVPSGPTTPTTSTPPNNTANSDSEPTPVAQPSNTTGDAEPTNPTTSNNAGDNETGTPTTSSSTDSNSSASASTSTAPSGGSGGSGGGATPAPSSIVPPDAFASCVSSKCKVESSSKHDLAFNVQAIEKVKEKDIKVVATAEAKVEDVSFDAQTGIVSLELKAPKKEKDFTLTLNAGKEKIVLNFTTKES